MSKFCGKCGRNLDVITGLCPNCDYDKIITQKKTLKYCEKCGSKLDEKTALCINKNCISRNSDFNNNSIAMNNKVQNKEPKKKSKALHLILTILLSICFLSTTLVSLVIYNVRSTLKDDKAEGIFDNINIASILNDYQILEEKDKAEFYNYLNDNYGMEVTDKKLNNFLNKSTFNSFVAGKLSDFINDFFEDEDEARITISYREIVNLLRKNKRCINDVFDVSLSNDEIWDIAYWITDDEFVNDIVILDVNDIENDAPAVCDLLKVSLSYTTMIIFIILSIIIATFMIINSLSQATCGIGIDLIIIGALTGLTTASAWIVYALRGSIISLVVGNFMLINILSSVIILAIGIVILVIRHLIIKKRKTKVLAEK